MIGYLLFLTVQFINYSPSSNKVNILNFKGNLKLFNIYFQTKFAFAYISNKILKNLIPTFNAIFSTTKQIFDLIHPRPTHKFKRLKTTQTNEFMTFSSNEIKKNTFVYQKALIQIFYTGFLRHNNLYESTALKKKSLKGDFVFKNRF